MTRIAGVNIPDSKRVEIALTYIYGIGRSTSRRILKQCRLDFNLKAKDLTTPQAECLREVINRDLKIEGDLRMAVSQNIKRLKEINSYRGIRHLKNLPVRGQRTRTNARTKRGKKVTVGSGRKKAAEKT